MQSNLRAHTTPGDSLLFAALLVMAFCVCGCAQPPTTICEAPSDVCVCEYNGKYYPAGAGFPSSDGCNSCSCEESGSVICTLKACVPQPQVCGGLRGAQCSDTQYCSFSPDAICGFADATGTCEPRPELCPTLVSPVCGCNGQTYNNECEAQRAGYSVSQSGECP